MAAAAASMNLARDSISREIVFHVEKYIGYRCWHPLRDRCVSWHRFHRKVFHRRINICNTLKRRSHFHGAGYGEPRKRNCPVVFRGPPASHDARTRSHDGLCTATTAAIRELTEPIRKTAEAIHGRTRRHDGESRYTTTEDGSCTEPIRRRRFVTVLPR